MAQLADLRTRVLTASIIAPAALLCIWWGGAWWSGLMLLCVAGLAWEWVRLCGGAVTRLPGAWVPAFALLGAGLALAGWPWAGLIVVLLGAGLVHRLAAGLPGFWLAFGVFYIGVAGIALLELRHDGAAGRGNVIFLFLVVWASDIGAYFTGRFLGGPKLAPAISPNKTWSGALGGVLGAMLVGVAAALALGGGSSIMAIAAVALVLGLASQSGDMFESWMKRRFGVKDSSALLPGHGGLLDRLDGVLAAAPLAALIGLAAGPGMHVWRWV
ncbi:CDP-archaeol synthase [Sediminicoccus sp. KRV36]|uniref:phosphatidate cytidylyltransferase n=1 Tax=Sediminicoccus sp. KRV36 TaxID=3133721 RepID=UPI00200E7BA5|nr:CDP-archaeol synthase [Sediminicoccus rosea]UPY35946.1 phosphatidate cytidylyltransferase [Sediminicoccus rosea]